MPRVVIDSAEREALKNEIAHLRGLDLGGLRARWHTVYRRRAPPHLPRHLLFRILTYRLQADRLGDLDADSRRLLDRIGSEPLAGIDRLVADLNRSRTELRPGTLLTREWDGQLQRVRVLADGFSWNGNTYRSLSKVAFAITGARWNGRAYGSSTGDNGTSAAVDVGKVHGETGIPTTRTRRNLARHVACVLHRSTKAGRTDHRAIRKLKLDEVR